ncbi:hypothetical protein NI389_09155 [Pseudoalteromonas xiamenensis]|uniref:hypothetical protein n=1 Tax=Pseudoalteromonas xiamenensis TaxID=882626 RepID=UPI0027E4274A|nr:hypothetical protein [Pseudoalteromonas xiamenensis]WMN58438.1 hypothetical protein NI389_09155 [Pseudoalteromonas xiamenensis]
MPSHWLKTARKIHKWLGYLLAAQLIAWLLGGFIMSAIPLEKVHGKHLAKRQLDNPFSFIDYTGWSHVDWRSYGTFKAAELSHFLQTPLIKIRTEKRTLYLNGLTGQPFVPPSQAEIAEQAKAHLLDANSNVAVIEKLEKGPREVGYRSNLWRVEMDDAWSTTLYLDAKSGQVLTVRSTLWRIFDFFWMLHIMDYSERENFNNPLLISFSATSVLFCLSGIILLFQAPPWRRRRAVR